MRWWRPEVRRCAVWVGLAFPGSAACGVGAGRCCACPCAFPAAPLSHRRSWCVCAFAAGVKVFIEPRAMLTVVGTVMDWHEDALSAEFVFTNPNAKSLCGCGESFSV